MKKTSSVLIIEDDDNIRQLYADALTNAKIDVHTATNGTTGVELALKHHPQVILIDIMMPEMDGHETVARIRKDKWGKNVHIIYLTNMSDAENVFHAIKQKPEEYIIKANTEVREVVNKVRTAMYT